MNITGGEYNGRKIDAPDEKIVRPTLSKVRMSVFNILFSLLGDFKDKTFLDMFGGSGIMGLEALSRGFKSAVVFEKNRTVANIIKNNYKQLGLTPDLHIGDSVKLAQKQETPFDVVFIDPPYMSGIYENSLNAVKNAGIIILEHTEAVDFESFEIIKQKQYGDKFLTFCKHV